MLDEGTAVFTYDADVRVEHVERRLPVSICDGFQGVRLVPVVGIDDADDLAGGVADPLVHGVVDAVVLFADDLIAVSLVGEFPLVFAGDLDSAVRRQTIDDDVLHFAIRLVENGFDRVANRLLAIETDGDDGNQHFLKLKAEAKYRKPRIARKDTKF